MRGSPAATGSSGSARHRPGDERAGRQRHRLVAEERRRVGRMAEASSVATASQIARRCRRPSPGAAPARSNCARDIAVARAHQMQQLDHVAMDGEPGAGGEDHRQHRGRADQRDDGQSPSPRPSARGAPSRSSQGDDRRAPRRAPPLASRVAQRVEIERRAAAMRTSMSRGSASSRAAPPAEPGLEQLAISRRDRAARAERRPASPRSSVSAASSLRIARPRLGRQLDGERAGEAAVPASRGAAERQQAAHAPSAAR